MDILRVPRQSLEVLTEIILQPRPSIPLVQLRKHMRLNNEKDQRIPTILIHIQDSVEVIGSDNPVCTLGQEHCSRKRRNGVGSLGGWSDGHKSWHAHRSPSVAMMWHCHDKATVINFWQKASKKFTPWLNRPSTFCWTALPLVGVEPRAGVKLTKITFCPDKDSYTINVYLDKYPDGSFTVPWCLKNVVLVLAKRTFWVQKSFLKKVHRKMLSSTLPAFCGQKRAEFGFPFFSSR